MAEQVQPLPGAPIAKDAIDPELIKLARTRMRIGAITAAGLTILCVYFAVRLNPDRRFASAGADPARVTASDIVAGKVAADSFVSIDTEPLMANAVRVAREHGSFGHRMAPVRGTGERLWLVADGDGFAPPEAHYTGRLRRLSDLPMAAALREYQADHPSPVFVKPAAARTGFANGNVVTVSGDQVTIGAGDKVGFETIDPNAATIVASFTDKLANADAWASALANAGVIVSKAGPPGDDSAEFTVHSPDAVASTTEKLHAAALWATRVDAVTRDYSLTWGELVKSPPDAIAAGSGSVTVPDAQVDLIALYAARQVPDDAYALIEGESPSEYWYVLPIMIALGVLGALFAWATVRAVKRDVLAPRVVVASE